jgi:hypothetical protein
LTATGADGGGSHNRTVTAPATTRINNTPSASRMRLPSKRFLARREGFLRTAGLLRRWGALRLLAIIEDPDPPWA